MSHVYQGLILRADEGAALEVFRQLESPPTLRLCRFAVNAYGVYFAPDRGPAANATEELLRLAGAISANVGAAIFYKWASGTGHHVWLFVEGRVYCRLIPLIDYAIHYPLIDKQWVELHKNLCLDDLSETNDLWIAENGALLPGGPRLLTAWKGAWRRPIAEVPGIWPSGDQPLLENGGQSKDALVAIGLPSDIEKRFDAVFNHDACGWIAEKN